MPDDKSKSKTTDPPAAEQSHPFYCPGCGRRWNYQTECRGLSDTQPHAPIEVVSTDELNGNPENHTPAPSGE